MQFLFTWIQTNRRYYCKTAEHPKSHDKYIHFHSFSEIWSGYTFTAKSYFNLVRWSLWSPFGVISVIQVPSLNKFKFPDCILNRTSLRSLRKLTCDVNEHVLRLKHLQLDVPGRGYTSVKWKCGSHKKLTMTASTSIFIYVLWVSAGSMIVTERWRRTWWKPDAEGSSRLCGSDLTLKRNKDRTLFYKYDVLVLHRGNYQRRFNKGAGFRRDQTLTDPS